MLSMALHPPVKRSVTIAGHPTSISLEPLFWDALEAAAEALGLPINALVARIDVERMEAEDPPNLTSAIRQWLWMNRVVGGTGEGTDPLRQSKGGQRD